MLDYGVYMSELMRFALRFSGVGVFQQSRSARTCLEELGAGEHAERARVLTIYAAANVFSEPELATRAAAEALEEARQAGDQVSHAWALVASSITDLSCTATQKRLEKMREALAISLDTDETELLSTSYFLYLAALAELGLVAELDIALSPVGTILGRSPQLNDGRHVIWFRCLQAMLSGDVLAAEELAEQGLRVSQSDDPDAQSVYIGQMGIIRWIQGRVVELEPLFLQARQAAPHEPVWAVSLAWMWLKQGRFSAAKALVAALPPIAALPVDRNWLSTACILTEVVSQLQDHEIAGELYAALLPYRDRLVTIGLGIACWGVVERPLALAALTLRNTEAAIAHYRRGIEFASKCGAHPWVAEMQWELARLLGEQPGLAAHEEAVVLVTESLATAQARHLHSTEEFAARTLASLRNTHELRRASASPEGATGLERPRIEVFGGFTVTAVNGSTARWQSRKARQLLKILVGRRGVAVSRETLMDMLWPDVSPSLLANRFSVAVAAVRRAFDPSGLLNRDAFLEHRDRLVRLRIDALDVDAEEFLDAVKAAMAADVSTADQSGRLLAALALYAGEPLPEEQGELWAADLRRETHKAFFSAAHALAELFAEDGDHLACLETYRRVLALDEFDQRAHEGTIRALTALGAHGHAETARSEYVRIVGSLGVPLDESLT